MNPSTSFPPDALIQLGWLAFGSIAISVAAISILGCIAFWKSGTSAMAFSQMVDHAQALKMVTVLLIVLSMLILTLVGKVGESGVVGVLSGIAGYVLGGLEKQSAELKKVGGSASEGDSHKGVIKQSGGEVS